MSLVRFITLILSIIFASAIIFSGCGKKSDKPGTDRVNDVSTTTPTDTLPSLQAQLDARRASFEQRASDTVKELYQSAIDDLRDSGILERIRSVGDTAPDFLLPTAVGDSLRLYDQLKQGPVVLAWYRGGWCPYCNLELLALNNAISQIESAGATLIAVSPEIPDSASNTVARDSLGFSVVSDVGNVVARKYGIAFKLPENIVESYSKHFDLSAYNGDQSYELPLPVTYVIDTNGVITYAFADADYRVRAEPAVVVREVKKIASTGE